MQFMPIAFTTYGGMGDESSRWRSVLQGARRRSKAARQRLEDAQATAARPREALNRPSP